MEVVWSGLAKITLFEVIEYVECKFGANTAFDIRKLIETSVQELSQHPNIGISCPVSFNFDYPVKYLIVKKSRVFYMVQETKIVILVIWDMRRNPKQLETLMRSFFP